MSFADKAHSVCTVPFPCGASLTFVCSFEAPREDHAESHQCFACGQSPELVIRRHDCATSLYSPYILMSSSPKPEVGCQDSPHFAQLASIVPLQIRPFVQCIFPRVALQHSYVQHCHALIDQLLLSVDCVQLQPSRYAGQRHPCVGRQYT
ncbi:hypothetical protein MRB53_037623 [Persea americana]|nr:hypothetical protein MRB53_037623 [Persea americana]